MCLISIAHRVSDRFPLVIAANRDESYDRPTHDAHFWRDAPDVLGGRDALHGGTWLAISRQARFAAVTNLRGAEQRPLSRGALVRDFVTSHDAPSVYAEALATRADQYSGFHLFFGDASGELGYATQEQQTLLPPGIYAASNAPPGEEWPKVALAADEMKLALNMDDAASALLVLMQFLGTPRNASSVESEVFIAGDRYGTRSSTVIVVTRDEIVFGEQSYARGGRPYSRNRLFRITR